MKLVLKAVLLLQVILLFGSCKKEDDIDAPVNGSTGPLITTSFSGQIKDFQGVPLSGVTVSAGGQTSTSDANGVYYLKDAVVDKERATLLAEKSGFQIQQKSMIASAGTLNYADIMLFSDQQGYSVNGVNGGIVTLPGNSTVQFLPNSFETMNGTLYTGLVKITAHEILTSDPDFTSKVPGGDMLAQDASGNDQLLLSYGMIGVKLYDAAGNSLKLVAGKKAKLRFPVNPDQLATAPGSIPLWYYNENLKKWKEEGAAVRSGNYYEGEVAHFSWWNCDIPCQFSHLYMSVKGCDGLPLQNEVINIQWNSMITAAVTNQLGICSGYIPANAQLTVTCSQMGFTNVDTTFTIGPFSPGSYNAINISLPFINCDNSKLTITDCSGDTVNGSVVAYYNNQWINFYTSQNGEIFIPNIMPGTYIFYTAVGFQTAVDTVVVTSSTQIPFNLNIQVCDTVQTTVDDLTLTITGSILGNITIGLKLIEARRKITNGNYVMELVALDTMSNDTSLLTVYTPGYVPGTFNWNTSNCQVNGYLVYNMQYYAFYSQSGSTTLSTTPVVSGNFSGSFTGGMWVDIMGVSSNCQVSANFNTIRTQ